MRLGVILNSKRDFYETTQEVLDMGVERSCQSCRHKFTLGDKVSIVITDRGNKALCGTCFDKAVAS